MHGNDLDSRLLAEILRIQRWIGGESVSAERVFGLLHGFECTLRQEEESFGISDELCSKVEDVLEDVESGEQATDGPSIKHRLHTNGIDELDAFCVMRFCWLGGRFTDGIKQIANGQGSVFSTASQPNLPETDWIGTPQYMELIDCTEGQRNKMHAVFAASLPRVGETITPENGSAMVVIGIDHVIDSRSDVQDVRYSRLIPHVLLEPADQSEN